MATTPDSLTDATSSVHRRASWDWLAPLLRGWTRWHHRAAVARLSEEQCRDTGIVRADRPAIVVEGRVTRHLRSLF